MSAARNPAQPLVVAVEGLSFTGKTSLAHALAPLLGGIVMPDYADLAALPPFPPRDRCDVVEALHHFLRLERHRARTARTAGQPVVLLDRSPLTLIAHEFGIAALGVPCDPALAAQLFSHAAFQPRRADRPHPDPHGYVYLRIPDYVTSRRAAVRGQVAAHLSHPRVRAGIEQASLRYLATLPASRWQTVDATRPPGQLATDAAGFIRRLATLDGPTSTWRCMAEPGWTCGGP